MFVCVVKSLQGLIDKAFDKIFLHCLTFILLHDVIKILLHVLKHEMEIIFDSDDFLQLDDVLMVKLP